MSGFDVFLLLLLIAGNGFFVAAEFAIVKVRASQIEIKLQSGHRLGKLAKNVHAHMDAYLSATQLGITLTSLAVGWFGEDVVARGLFSLFGFLNFSISTALVHQISFVCAFLLITILHIVVGELVPKSLAIQYPVAVTFAVVAPLRWFYFVFSPFIWLLNHASALLIRLMGLRPAGHKDQHSSEELRLLLEQGKNQGVIQSVEHDIIRNVFFSSEKTAKQIMVPRPQIEALDINTPLEAVVEKFVQDGYSRLPVYRDHLDNIVGILYAKEALKVMRSVGKANWKDRIVKPHFVPESKKIITLLREFQSRRYHMAMVVDEFGSTSGLVTFEDVIEELVGEIQDEYDHEVPMIERSGKHEWRINGLASVQLVNQYLPVALPEPGDFDTMSGFANWAFGRIPQSGDKLKKFGYDMTILKATKRKVELVILKQSR